jgi:septal ring factor EnvC (AmiA/AmiB activator)
LFTASAKSQTYTPNVSKDSLGVLKDRTAILKTSLKLYELKIKESEEEGDVEKLRVKLLASNAKAKESAAQNSDLSKKIASLDAKTIEKSAKRAKDDMADSQRALESYNKQIKRVEAIRSDIRIEEEKLLGMKQLIVFDKK